VAKVEGKLDDKTSEDELSDEFEALLVNTIDDEHDKVTSGYFIIIESFFTSLIILTSIINALVNDLISHFLLH
jgi:hypothetical protein